VEWVNLRVTGVGPLRTPELPGVPPGDGDPARARTGSRPVWFDRAAHDTPTYRREELRAGDVVRGPAVLEEFGSTVPVAPGFRAQIDALGNVILTKEA
jgi:N-methylhydantoinase A